MATTPEVKIKISADGKGVDTTVAAIRGSLKQLGSDLTRVQSLATSALGFAGIGGAASVAGIIAIAKQTANAADEMANLAQRTGVSVEELSRLGYAAKMSDASLEDVSAGLKKLSVNMVEAADGTPAAAQKFAQLGISVRDASGNLKSSDAVLKEVADRFANMADGAAKSALAQDLFGKSGLALIPLLNSGAAGLKSMADEADRFGVTISTDLAKKAEEFNDTLDRLQSVAQGLGQDLGAALIPALTDLSVAFLQTVDSERQLGADNGIKEWADTGARAVALVVDVVGILGRVLKGAGLSLGAYVAAAGAALKGNFKEAKQIVTELGSDLRGLAGDGAFSFSERLAKQQSAEVQASQGAAEKRLKVEKDLAAAVQTLFAERQKASQKANEEELKGVERLKEALQNAWQASIDGAQKARDAAAGILKSGGDAAQSTRDAAADRLAKGLTPAQQERRAVDQASQAMKASELAAAGSVVAAYEGDLKKAGKLAEDAAKQAERAKGFADKITDDKTAAAALNQVATLQEAASQAQAKVKEQEAAELEAQAEAQNQQITQAEERIKALKAELGKPVDLQANVTNAENEVKRLQGELEKLKDKTVTVTVNTVNTAGGAAAPAQGGATGSFASGGYTGPGGKFQPAGVVHAGEFVVRSEIVRNAQVRAMLEQLNRTGMSALKGYSGGGFVGGASQAPINLHWPDGSVSQVSAEKAVADQIARTFRRAALSRGRRS